LQKGGGMKGRESGEKRKKKKREMQQKKLSWGMVIYFLTLFNNLL